MAQLPEATRESVKSTLAESRRSVKRALKLAKEANTELARAEANLYGLDDRLEEFGIRLEVEE